MCKLVAGTDHEVVEIVAVKEAPGPSRRSFPDLLAGLGRLVDKQASLGRLLVADKAHGVLLSTGLGPGCGYLVEKVLLYPGRTQLVGDSDFQRPVGCRTRIHGLNPGFEVLIGHNPPERANNLIPKGFEVGRRGVFHKRYQT